MENAQQDIERGAAAVLAASRVFTRDEGLMHELERVAQASDRGYFLPEEEESVRLRYMQYLSVRSALLETLESLAQEAGQGRHEWEHRLPAFITAFAAACMLLRAGRFVTGLAAGHPVLWKKLDEEDLSLGLPRKTFSAIYRSTASPANLVRFHAASEFYHGQRDAIHALRDDPVVGPVVSLLMREEERIERRRRDALRRHLSYRIFSFRRRQRSAWRKVMFGLFEVAGSAIAELRLPGVKPVGAAKRVTPQLRSDLTRYLQPGDVLVTRHDDAMSNLFLPGFWPHAVLYLGSAEERDGHGVPSPDRARGEIRFLEARKDGVRFRPIEETLDVDACVVIRPPLSSADLAMALTRAMAHEGKLYDFLFDFRAADRLACTGVIYRGFNGVGPVHFRLREVSGRLCLPAEDLLDQALECGFRVVAACGIGTQGLLLEGAAEDAFRATRKVS